MKKLRIITLIFSLFLVAIACDNDGGESFIELNNGALSYVKRTAGSPEFIVNTTFPSLELKFDIRLIYGEPVSYNLRALYRTIGGDFYGPVTIIENVTTFTTKDFSLLGSEVMDAFPQITNALDMQAGDNIMFYPAFIMKDGTVLETLNSKGQPNYYAADFNQITDLDSGNTYSYFVSYPVVCAPKPGIYTIDMHDSFGDGWQTNDDNGGNGIQLILDGVVADEFGMCSPYQASPYSGCVMGDYYDATTTVEIPEGTEIAVWQFPGDTYGEIGFEIYGPDGQLLLQSAFGAEAGGPLTVILCAD